jgi:hypothetical protein
MEKEHNATSPAAYPTQLRKPEGDCGRCGAGWTGIGLGASGSGAAGAGARGTTCWLSAEHQAALLAQCRRGAFRTYGEAQCWVTREGGVSYRYDGLHTLLTRLGVHPKVPRPAAVKADPAVQEAWKRGISARR